MEFLIPYIFSFLIFVLCDVKLYEASAIQFWSRWKYIGYNCGTGFYMAYKLYTDKGEKQ